MRRLSMALSLCCAFIWMAGALATSHGTDKKMTIRGHLEQTVEAGGWLIVADTDERTDKYLLLNPKRFQKESWFRVGAQVEVTGIVKRDAVTIYQEGIPFEARTMRPLGGNDER